MIPALLILGSGEARAQVEWNNTLVTEYQINAIPLDLEVTPNGKVAVVRSNLPGSNLYNNQKVTFWRTDTGASITPGGTPPASQGNLPWVASTGKPLFSDALAVTNDVAVAISSAAVGYTAENTTYVDIYRITYPGGVPQVDFLTSHTLGGGTNFNTLAGTAHDVAITPNGSLAVVNHTNWIHVFDLSTGGIYRSIHIGGVDSQGNKGPCSPINIRNSVAVTNSRAIVTTGRGVLAQRKGWVYIVDLTTADPVSFPEFQLTNSGTNEHPHDVAVSPNGQLAVVTANSLVGVYDLVNQMPVGTPISDGQDRLWNFTPPPGHYAPDLWDSVELSDTQAVVIGNQIVYDPQSQNNFYYWAARVIDISQSSYSAHAVVSGVGASYYNDPAWDLALSADGKVATVKSSAHDVALLDVVNSPTSAFISGFLSGANYPQSSGINGMNDATVILAPKRVGTSLQRWAVFAGPNGANTLARLHFYDLSASSWPVGGGSVVIQTMSELHPTTDIIAPADLELAPGGTEAIARLTETYDDSGQVGGHDWSAWGGAPPAQAGYSLGGKGKCVGADSLRMGTQWAVSTSRDPLLIKGWVHIVHSVHESQYP